MNATKFIMRAVIASGALVTAAAFADEAPVTDATPAEQKQITPQATCPVMGGKINKELYVDAEGKRIYVCCNGCIAAVKQDPAKYIQKLEEQGVTVATVPTDDGTKARCPAAIGCPRRACHKSKGTGMTRCAGRPRCANK